jgi:hypothetical protein
MQLSLVFLPFDVIRYLNIGCRTELVITAVAALVAIDQVGDPGYPEQGAKAKNILRCSGSPSLWKES